MCRFYNEHFGLRFIILRPPNIYGPGSDHGVVFNFLKSIKETGGVTIFGDGKQTRDFLYIDDMIEVIMKAVEYNERFQVFNVGSGKNYSLLELIDCIGQALNQKIKVEFAVAESHSAKDVSSNIRRAKKMLEWEPKTDLLSGIRLMFGKDE